MVAAHVEDAGQEKPAGGGKLEPSELARRIVEIAEDRKAEDIVMLDIRKLSIISDYFVICNGTGDRHVKAIAREIDEKLGHVGVNPRNVEGANEGEWVLMDYADVVVHIFQPSVREHYRLEQLWSGAQPVLVVQ
jgi:ribosome-associated protein